MAKNDWYQPVDFGRSIGGTLNSLRIRLKDFREDPTYFSMSDHGRGDHVMGFSLPHFQRDRVWTLEQSVAFVNSARRGLPLGTYTYNVTSGKSEAMRKDETGRSYFVHDLLLIDGYQRLSSLQDFFDDVFPVDGMFWSGLDSIQRRVFLQGAHFPSYETSLTDEEKLKELYDLMNFGGTRHQEHERAVPLKA